jgi:predicted alpha-1,6-mannanase (GH76 family)
MWMADSDYRAWAAAGITALQRWYDPSTGQWKSTSWWNAANALTAVIGYTKLTGDGTHAGVIGTTFTAARRRHADFINNYYDDNGWWALAWVAAYDLTRDRRYLDAARTIFAHNVAGWDDTCAGGLWWNESKTYKNAITTELFLTLAARLHQRAPGDHGSYLTWALRAWDWFSSHGLIGADGLVNDGLTATCENNGGTTWTYNQGVILGGLGALFEITGDHAYLAQGESIAGAVLSKLTTPPSAGTPGILTEPCEAGGEGCNGDQVQFKGIFVRYLYDFWLQSRQPAHREFILGNARSLWAGSRSVNDEFGLRWTGPFDQADAARQSSALDGLNAAVALAPGQLGADHEVHAVKAPAGLGVGPGGLAVGTRVVEIGAVRATAAGAGPRDQHGSRVGPHASGPDEVPVEPRDLVGPLPARSRRPGDHRGQPDRYPVHPAVAERDVLHLRLTPADVQHHPPAVRRTRPVAGVALPLGNPGGQRFPVGRLPVAGRGDAPEQPVVLRRVGHGVGAHRYPGAVKKGRYVEAGINRLQSGDGGVRIGT